MPQNNEKRIKEFVERFPLLSPTLSALDTHKIEWMIGGSGNLFLLGNDRIPDDVDIYLRNEDHDRADEIFKIKSFEYKSETERVRNSNPEGDHSIQLTSHLRIIVDSKEYDLHISDEVMSNRIKLSYGQQTIWLLPPEDVLLIKALLQRGKDVGKNDIEDINKFKSIYSIDHSYLMERIKGIGAEKRVSGIFPEIL
ncbi:MAG TPA: nucleotidyltransferase [Candidatus Paceibacterota bacterium]|nr:nucleotidyltransferase [Candidatus Paceibacterota bacterium]